MNLIILFSFYPILYLIIGNYARLFLFPLAAYIFLQQYKKGELYLRKEFIYIFLILLIYNISSSLINSTSFKFLSLHIGQLFIFILFSSVPKTFIIEINKRLRLIALIIITFVFIVFFIKVIGIDITPLMNISRYLEIKYELSREIPIKDVVFSLTEGINSRLSLGNPTLMCTFLFLIMLMQESNSKTNKLAILITPVVFLAKSRTFLITLIIYFLTNLNLNKLINQRKKSILLFMILLIIGFLSIDKNLIIFLSDQISIFLRTDILKPQNFIFDESRRISYFINVFKNIDDFLIIGKGPGYSYQFIQDFFGYSVSSESTYLRLILHYGLFPSIFLSTYFLLKIRQTKYLSKPKLIVLIISAFTVTFLDNDFSYVLLGISCNKNLMNENHLNNNDI